MKAYRTGAKIKLGLIVVAVLIALASLWYTNALANRLMLQEREAVTLWARALEQQARQSDGNPYADEFAALEELVEASGRADAESLQVALAWGATPPEAAGLDFIFEEIIRPARFSVPTIITDESLTVASAALNVEVDSSGGTGAIQAQLLETAAEMDQSVRYDLGDGFIQVVHFGESEQVRDLRTFPAVQLGFVALFVLVGYFGFSYVRRSEQSSLWVGMAKEAAHQLGTPLTSLVGWIELLRLQHEGDEHMEMVADELEHDVDRLKRVADRFSKIGSTPELAAGDLGAAVARTADYIRRRMPSQSRDIAFHVEAPEGITVAMNAVLLEWVVENLLKNALDALDAPSGSITATVREEADQAFVTISDTGKGIERKAQRMIFRPGFSTKKRGWGLGLSLAKRIVEDYHGGSLELVESRPGAGTTFRITLDTLPWEPESGATALQGRR